MPMAGHLRDFSLEFRQSPKFDRHRSATRRRSEAADVFSATASVVRRPDVALSRRRAKSEFPSGADPLSDYRPWNPTKNTRVAYAR